MVCRNCNRVRADHTTKNDIDFCIGVEGTYQPKITNMSAEFLYVNPQGVAESRDATLMHLGRSLARIDNIVDQLLADGNTNISINITNS
jgi:hypothetical protein